MAKQIREVKLLDLITHAVLAPLAIVAIWVLTPTVLIDLIELDAVYVYTGAALLTYFPLKWTAIGAVLVYKAVAPLSVRSRCLFTPTCSTYMIMSIYKYGLFIGVIKGIRRLLRCKPPNGGVDYP